MCAIVAASTISTSGSVLIHCVYLRQPKANKHSSKDQLDAKFITYIIMSKPHASPLAADTSEDKDDEEIVALLPPSAEKADGPSNAASLRRTPGPNSMRRNEHVSCTSF